jgi:hydroxymethylbilane synthase
VVGTADGALVRASATGDLDGVEELGAALAVELLDLAGGTLAAVREAASPAPPQIVPSGVDR